MNNNKNRGILDPLGEQNNPLTDKPYSETYKELGKIWSQFPAYTNAKEIINDLKEHQVTLIISGTGSGKTVLVPKYVLHSYNYDGKIAVTLPKQIITKSSAEFSAKTLDVELGKEVGYQYKGSPRDARSKDTKLLYATDGTIVARLMNDIELKDFDAIIIDEAHERKVQIDFLLYLLRETLRLRPEFKLIIMSATINAEIFKNYFSEFKFKEINIGGQTNYPIKSIFIDKDIQYNEILDKGFDILKEVAKKEKSESESDKAKDILFFITSANEAFDTCKKLSAIDSTSNVFCIEVYAGMDSKKQELAQDKDKYKTSNSYNLKVVIATNVAESSLTIDGIKYVIDSGHELSSSYDPDIKARRLDRQLITHAQAKQRMGRSGRTEPGICYHLYTQDTFENKMKKFPEPDIRVNNITDECLRLLDMPTINTIPNLINILTQFIEPPKESFIKDAVNTLIQLGLIKDEKLTDFGKLVANIGATSLVANVTLVYSYIYNCSYEMVKIIAMIDACKQNLDNVFILPTTILQSKKQSVDTVSKEAISKAMKEEKWLTDKFEKAKKKFRHKYGDHQSLLKIYEKFNDVCRKNRDKPDKMNKLNEWCHTHFLKLDVLLKARMYYRKLNNNLERVRDDLNSFTSTYDPGKKGEKIIKSDIDDRILYCLSMGNSINTAHKVSGKKGDMYRTRYSKELPIKIDKNSFLYLYKKLPKNVIYTELFVMMGNANINIVSKNYM